MNRCEWATTDPLLQKYHDEEWGIPVHDDREHYMYMLMASIVMRAMVVDCSIRAFSIVILIMQRYGFLII